MFTGILWDFDGTLFDTYPGTVQTLLRALRDEGIQEDYDEAMARMHASISEALGYYIEKYGLGKPFEEKLSRYRRETVKENIGLFPHAADMIRAVYVAGRRNFLYTHRGDSAIEYLEMHGLIDCFQDCITYEDGFPMKPDPAAILYLIGKHKLDKDKSLMVGDRDIDMLAAKNAGITGCFFDPGADAASPSADYHIRSLDELYSIIGLENR